VKVTQLYGWHGLKRIETRPRTAGDIVAVAGIEEITSATPSPTASTRAPCPPSASTSPPLP
jgi:predicted membrane GTPase involved in stress response